VVLTARLLKVVSAFLIGLLALSACGTQPGAAAVVNGSTIAERDVSQASTELGHVLAGEINPQAVLQILVIGPSAIQLAARNGMGISAAEAEEFLNNEALANEQEPAEEYSQSTLTVARYLLLENVLRTSPDAAELGAELEEEIGALDVELSPRYGEWTPQGPVQTQPDWILEPEPQAA